MLFAITFSFLAVVSATIYQNEQVRGSPYPGQAAEISLDGSWHTYAPNSSEISYLGRWDSQYISWWSAPGLRFGFTGDKVALEFGNWTNDGVLVAWRLDGQDWQFSNVSANASYHFINPRTTGFNLSTSTVRTFEMRVTNWAYGVQLAGVAVGEHDRLVEISRFPRTVEIIGDSLSAGQYGTYEGISSWSWGFGAGLGNAEFSISAYPGICLVDTPCWGNAHGQTYQWYQTSDTSPRSVDLYGDKPEPWDFSNRPAADLVVINLGTNDNNTHNNVSGPQFQQSYIDLIHGVHDIWPNAQVVVFSLWIGFSATKSTFEQQKGFAEEIMNVIQHFEPQGFVHLFNTTGILQHNDIGPQYHPTDVGHIKVASHLLQFVRQQFGWEFGATGPEVQSQTLYWNDQSSY